MRVATFNVNSLTARMEQLTAFCEESAPDVLCLQETKLTDDRFPREALEALGYPHQVFTGQKSYNGVAMLSRHPIDDPQTNFREGKRHPAARIVAGTVQGVRIYGLYCPNGTQVGSDRYHGKLAWFRRLREEIGTHHTPDDALILTGDFNITPTANDAWDPFRSEGQLLCTAEEREVFESLIGFGLVDTWREMHPYDVGFTWWDYQRMGFSRNQGLRIDHFLVTEPIYERVTACEIQRHVRGWERPSDHAPVLLDLD